MKVSGVSNSYYGSRKSGALKTSDQVNFSGNSIPLFSKVLKWGFRLAAPLLLTVATIDTFEKYSYEGMEEAGIVDYVEPKQEKFETRQQAFDYAKTRVVEALQAEPPYEHAVLINNATNEILAEFKGDEDKVVTAVSFADMIKLAYQQKGYSMVHGHPAYKNDVTTPLGFQDFTVFVENEDMTEIAAVNKYGEFSCLRKRPTYQSLDGVKVQSLYKEFLRILTNSVKKNTPCLWKDYTKALMNVADSTQMDSIDVEFSKVLNKQDSIPDVVKKVQKFWKKHAPQNGMDYYTNYREIREK